VSHQITLGQNLQMCVSLGALLGEAKDIVSTPPAVAVAAGAAQALSGGMGAMQFTIGSSAQFTLGQSFEISIGPPKVEIHKQHSKKYDLVRTLCVLLGALSEVFSFMYDHLKGSNEVSKYTNATGNAQAAALANEESGDQERAHFILAYQLLTDAMLVAILLAEYITDKVDWYGADVAKKAYAKAPGSFGLWEATSWTPVPDPTKPDDPPDATDIHSWSGKGQIKLGLLGVAAMLLAELTAMPVIGDKADSN